MSARLDRCVLEIYGRSVGVLVRDPIQGGVVFTATAEEASLLTGTWHSDAEEAMRVVRAHMGARPPVAPPVGAGAAAI
jgi:hypothetical protein